MILASRWGGGVALGQEPGIFLFLEYVAGGDTQAHFHGASDGWAGPPGALTHRGSITAQTGSPASSGPTTDFSTGTPATAPPWSRFHPLGEWGGRGAAPRGR